MTAPITLTNSTQIITDLIELARTINLALDDSEEFEGEDGRAHAITGQHFDDVCEAIHRLESLPDDNPGVCLGPAQKAEWALRHMLAAHPDDVAVDALAALMKAKLEKQRSKGYSGWDADCSQQRLSDMLRAHVEKGDPVDVANFCAFLTARGEGIAPQADSKPAALSSDTLYLLRRLLSNQHTLTGPEFRAELEKIVEVAAANKQGGA